MSPRMHTIGELSRLTGLPVRRIRFYSDQGLLPPALRTEAGYRMYSDADVARIDLIRALREAGVGLPAVQRILSSRLSLTEVLRLRLDAVEAEIAAKRRIAAALRGALRRPDPTETDLRRLWTVTTLSNTQFRSMIERFYDQVAGEARMDDAWRQQMIEAGTPVLPDDPTGEQLDAWIELAGMIDDPAFVAEVKADAAAMWTDDFDPQAYAEAAGRTFAAVRQAMAEGVSPVSPTGLGIARDWLEGSARAMRHQPDAAFLKWHEDQYRRHFGRSARYQALLAVLRGEDGPSAGEEWRWIHEAMAPLMRPTN